MFSATTDDSEEIQSATNLAPPNTLSSLDHFLSIYSPLLQEYAHLLCLVLVYSSNSKEPVQRLCGRHTNTVSKGGNVSTTDNFEYLRYTPTLYDDTVIRDSLPIALKLEIGPLSPNRGIEFAQALCCSGSSTRSDMMDYSALLTASQGIHYSYYH